MNRDDDAIILHLFLHDEIKREDDITNQIFTSACVFQEFLIASMTFLLNGAWPAFDKTGFYICLVHFRVAVLGGIGILRILVAATSTLGFRASRKSISLVIATWEKEKINLELHPILPQDYE